MNLFPKRFVQAIQWMDFYPVQLALTAFEAVLGAELGLTPLYVVQPKAAFDTAALIEGGARCFPDDVWAKAPDAIPDIMQGTRCIAFELFSAAASHLHRANEAVLRRYWDAVTDGASRPSSRNMGDYLTEMNKKNVGDEKVRAALKDLKDLHRNPLIHPEHSLESADEAIALMNGRFIPFVHMPKEMPERSSPRTARGASFLWCLLGLGGNFFERSLQCSSSSASTSSAVSMNRFDCSGSSGFVGLRGMNQPPFSKGNLSCRGSSRQRHWRLRGRLYRSALAPIEQSCFVGQAPTFAPFKAIEARLVSFMPSRSRVL